METKDTIGILTERVDMFLMLSRRAACGPAQTRAGAWNRPFRGRWQHISRKDIGTYPLRALGAARLIQIHDSHPLQGRQ